MIREPMEVTLWEFNGWVVARHMTGGSAGRLKLINPDGRTVWPVFYEPLKIGLEHPEWWPSWLTEAAKIINLLDRHIESGQHWTRLQLCTMAAFMEATDDGVPHHGAMWWAGELPIYISEYVPEKWAEANKSIFMIWSDYLAELCHVGLSERAVLAEELAIADLLAASEAADINY